MTTCILFVALCCVLFFPITAMAEEIIEEPIALPENMTITKQLFSDSGELEPEKITIKSHEDGQFSFEYPAKTVSDMRGYGDNHSITAFHVEGTANYRIDEEKERKFGAVNSKWIVGEFTVPDEIVYTVLTPSVSENYSNISKFRMVPYEGSLETTSYDDKGSEHHILFKLQFHCTRTDTVYDVEGGAQQLKIHTMTNGLLVWRQLDFPTHIQWSIPTLHKTQELRESGNITNQRIETGAFDIILAAIAQKTPSMPVRWPPLPSAFLRFCCPSCLGIRAASSLLCLWGQAAHPLPRLRAAV